MEHGTKQGARRRDGWVAHLVQVQLAMGNLGARGESPTAEDRWPARLIHAGTVLIGVSGLVLATWLRRRL
jgi:hypothetical protein